MLLQPSETGQFELEQTFSCFLYTSLPPERNVLLHKQKVLFGSQGPRTSEKLQTSEFREGATGWVYGSSNGANPELIYSLP